MICALEKVQKPNQPNLGCQIKEGGRNPELFVDSARKQVTAGDIRMMMPCSRAAAAGGAAAFAQTASGLPSPADETMTQAEETMDPTFLVVVLSGFSVSSQMPEHRTPRPTRLSNLARSGACQSHIT